jgi:hypothetical protein
MAVRYGQAASQYRCPACNTTGTEPHLPNSTVCRLLVADRFQKQKDEA